MRPERVVLRDGRQAVVRQIRPEDASLLRTGFESLSEGSRTARFLAPKAALTDAEVAYFTDVDHRDHEALVASDVAGTRGLGVARYIRHSEDPHRAEFAVVVVDDFQGSGLASALLERLAGRARRNGIIHFEAYVLPQNRRMLELARRMWTVEQVTSHPGVTQISLFIGRPPWWRRLLYRIAMR
jgi:GNAT superfamily N-acetyltransferase